MLEKVERSDSISHRRAEIGGTPLAELNALELDFLFAIDFDLGVHPADYAACTADFRVGGTYRIEARGLESDEAFNVTGVYREITPPAKIAYTWTYEGDEDWADCESVVSVEFKAIGDQTELRLTHTGFPSAESRGNHSQGWGACMDKIDSLLSGQPAPAC